VAYCPVKNRERKLKSRYGITIEEYNHLLKKQRGRCAICKLSEDEHTNSLAVDHCHSTGKVRGLLCTSCNVALGHFKDKPLLMYKAVLYLHKD
jgi:hypothetical protein